jgi:Domain of unknown function (DUF4430)
VTRPEAIRASVAAVAAALALAGCGLGAGTTPAHVSLLVTRGFGAQTLLADAAPKISGADTVMRMLERNATVATRFGGGFVQRIDGVAGGGGRDWFYYVNGVEQQKGAAETRLHDGDQVWWDRHDWSVTQDIPAVVGAFPEPFAHGYDGKRLPRRIECTQTRSKACAAVSQVFAAENLVAGTGCLLCSQYNLSLRVLVGPYRTLRADPAADLLARGVSASGIYARFDNGGRTLALLDQNGHVVTTAGAGAGLVAATRFMGQPPVWFVTGTDAAGVNAAVQAFNAQTLDQHFAVAVVAGAAIPLPDNRP